MPIDNGGMNMDVGAHQHASHATPNRWCRDIWPVSKKTSDMKQLVNTSPTCCQHLPTKWSRTKYLTYLQRTLVGTYV